MFNAKVYKLSVISLSGIMAEVHVAKETVQQWNQQHAERVGKLFQSVDDARMADVIIAVVGGWLDSTALIEQSLEAEKTVLLFFNGYADPTNTIACEQAAVNEYKSQMQQRCYCGEYNSPVELTNQLEERINVIQ